MTRLATWLGGLVSVVVLGVGAEARAMCVRGTAEVEAWPEGSLAPRGLILLTLDHTDSNTDDDRLLARLGVPEWELAGPKGRTAALAVVQRAESRARTQLLLQPTEPLVVGTTYRLELGSKSFAWKVAKASESPPMWSATAWEVDRSYAAGCPFSAHLGLGIPVAGGGDDLLVEVRASDASRGELVDYEPLVNGGIRLRYGSCKGGILLDAGRASELHLVAIDQQGRRVPMPGSLELVAPGPAPRDGMRWTAALAADERRVVACSTRQGRRWEGLYGFGLVALSFMVGGWWLVTGRMPARAGAVKE